MSHPMVKYILDNLFAGREEQEYRYTFTALSGESIFIDMMRDSHKDG